MTKPIDYSKVLNKKPKKANTNIDPKTKAFLNIIKKTHEGYKTPDNTK